MATLTRSASEVGRMQEYSRIRGARRPEVSAEVMPPPSPKLDAPRESDDKTAEEAEQLRAALGRHILFSNLDGKQTDLLVSEFDRQESVGEEEVITEGDDGSLFYIVRSGRYAAFKGGRDGGEASRKIEYAAGDAFGELALMYNQPRAASVRASGEGCSLWALDRATFQSALQSTHAQKKASYQEVLRSVPLLQNLTEEEMAKLVDAMQPRFYTADSVVIEQGASGDSFFIVIEGEVLATRAPGPGEDAAEPFSYAEKDFFGEMALLTNQPRAATVVAKTDTVLASLDKPTFLGLVGSCEEILQERVDEIRSASNASCRSPLSVCSLASSQGYGSNTSTPTNSRPGTPLNRNSPSLMTRPNPSSSRPLLPGSPSRCTSPPRFISPPPRACLPFEGSESPAPMRPLHNLDSPGSLQSLALAARFVDGKEPIE